MNGSERRDRQRTLGTLQARIWDEGGLDPATLAAVPSLIDLLVSERSARVALLLGRIVETADDPAARAAVRQGLASYLDLLGGASSRRGPLFLALLFLLSHLHEDSQAILARLRAEGWAGDADRVERVLSFQAAAGSDAVEHMRRLMAVPAAASAEQAWRRIVTSVLASFGAEAADAVLREEAEAAGAPPC